MTTDKATIDKRIEETALNIYKDIQGDPNDAFFDYANKFIKKHLKSLLLEVVRERDNEILEIAKRTTFGHYEPKTATIIAMDYQMFVKGVKESEKVRGYEMP